MTILIWCAALSMILMVLPIFAAMLSAYMEKSEPLFIRQENSKNPRYFAISFSKMIEKALETYDGSGVLHLSRDEKILEADIVPLEPGAECNELVCAVGKEFAPPEGVQFNKEIYAKYNVSLVGTKSVRAVASGENLYIGAGTKLVRWADALGDVTAEENCQLGISVSAGRELRIGKNCSFRRLYAKEIIFDEKDETKDITPAQRKILELEKSLNHSPSASKIIQRGVKYVDENNTDENQCLNASIITKHDLTVLNGYIVQGNVRSHKSVRLDKGGVICGNLFAEGDVFLENDSRVYGDIFSQGSIFIGANVHIGQYGKVKSIVAREKIQIDHSSRVFGYISAEKGGLCCPALEGLEGKADPKTDVAKAVAAATGYKITMNQLEFSDPKEFISLNPSCFREQGELGGVVIPEGVEKIGTSFFYQCENLARAVLPASLTEIEDFAFYGCKKLQEVVLPSNSSLTKIGVSAFEGCEQLKFFVIPAGVSFLGEAAFRNCQELTAVKFDRKNTMTTISQHLFQNCTELKELQLPDMGVGIRDIGTSAFYGCGKLQQPQWAQVMDYIGYCAFEGVNFEPPIMKEQEKNTKIIYADVQLAKSRAKIKKKREDRKKKVKGALPQIGLVACCALCAFYIYKLPTEMRSTSIVSYEEQSREEWVEKHPFTTQKLPVASFTYIMEKLKTPKETWEEGGTKAQPENVIPAQAQITPLPESLLGITDEYVILTNRTMRRYKSKPQNVLSASQAANKALGSLPKGINKYYLAAPDALSLETGAYAKYSNGYEETVEKIYSKLSPDITAINAFDALRDRNYGQLFLNSDIMWTAMGARYTANEFIRATGAEPAPLSDFKTENVREYNGALGAQRHGYKVPTVVDQVEYFVWRENNTETITRTINDEIVKYEAPAIALSRGGYNIFLGTQFNSVVIEGNPSAEGTLLIVGSRMANGLAVWLEPHYKKVIVLNDERFQLSSETMKDYLKEYDVTDVLIVTEAEKITSFTAQQHLLACFGQK
ncbi:MAG: DHHW family protein [Oscillospiraceae bacterium]